MSNKPNILLMGCLLFLAISNCSLADEQDVVTGNETVTVLIIGSAENPDPVLERVMELEKKGILKNVIVRESFPVQIEVTGPGSVIKKIQAIPKKESPAFK